ncbi:MAG: roadblock/LC7 domain-containing protein [Anaerolineae bacterium]|nr:roadblock/LC7 domain-containing protein [Anaerolineae bacterium]
MSDNEHQPGATEPTSLKEILHEMNEAGRFQVSVLTSTEGLPIATVPAGYNSDLTAAMVAMLQRASNDAQSHLGMAEVDEMTIRDRDRSRLVCRYIVVGGEELILATIVPSGHPYRRVTNRAIKQIEQLLS